MPQHNLGDLRKLVARHRQETAKIPPKDERQPVKPYLFYAMLPDPVNNLQAVMLPLDWINQVPDRYDTLAARSLWRSRCRLKQDQYRLVEMTEAEINRLPMPVRIELERREGT